MIAAQAKKSEKRMRGLVLGCVVGGFLCWGGNCREALWLLVIYKGMRAR